MKQFLTILVRMLVLYVRRFDFTNHDIKYLDLLKQYGNCHFGEERFLILEDRLKQKDYLKYLNSYYTLVKREFRIGLGNESNYITLENGLVEKYFHNLMIFLNL